MADESKPVEAVPAEQSSPLTADYDEFEVGEHKVPWFLWLFFALIVTWAAVSWYPFFGY